MKWPGAVSHYMRLVCSRVPTGADGLLEVIRDTILYCHNMPWDDVWAGMRSGMSGVHQGVVATGKQLGLLAKRDGPVSYPLILKFGKTGELYKLAEGAGSSAPGVGIINDIYSLAAGANIASPGTTSDSLFFSWIAS